MNELNIVKYALLTGETIQRFNTVCTLVAACIRTVVQDQVGWTNQNKHHADVRTVAFIT